MDCNLEDIFKILKEAQVKEYLDLIQFETDYVEKFSFTISKYKKQLYDKKDINNPDCNTPSSITWM